MKIVIIGGVAAGAKAAAKSRRLLPEAQIDIYTDDSHVSYSACGLPYYIQGNFENWQKLVIRSVEEFEKSNIHIHLFNRVIKILPEEKKIVIQDLKTETIKTDSYDKLVIATGAAPNLKNYPEISLNNIFTLRTLEDGVLIKNAMQNSDSITLIGGGYIGIELLEAFIKNNKKVYLIEKNPYILSVFDEDISALIQAYILENSNNLVSLITNDTVSEFIGEGNVSSVRTSSGQVYPADMVVISAGVKPVVDIAVDAGIKLGTTGAIKVNSRMETSVKDVYACGDCAEKINIVSNTPVWVPLGSTANKEGRVAAVNLCGGSEDFEGILSSAVTRFLDLNISMTGLSEKVAQSLGYDTVNVIVTKKDKAGYMPEVQNITLKLIADRRSHRILGAQAIGCGDADKKVNNISMGLHHRITVEDLLDVDFTYAPPFSTSVDIIHTAAQMIKSKLS
ncbi:FAD-dependent oxidoreductase [bacterium]|nr:FAD-dependent oxidoreductase [bacterium]